MFEDMHPRKKSEMDVHDRAFKKWASKEMRAGRLVCFLVTAANGRAVAGGSVWLRDVQPFPGFPGGKVPYLMSMFTEGEFRGKGLATEIVNRAISWSRDHGYPALTLHASDMGLPLYRKMGFKRTREMELEFKPDPGTK